MKYIISLIICTVLGNSLYAQKGSYADVNGVRLYYEVYGEGEPLVFLHGFTMSHKMWEEWVDDFTNHFKVILVDLRGHGNSSNPSNIFRHRESAKDIFALLDHLKIDKFKAMGYSSGAMTLLHMATMDSSRLEAMALLGASSYYPEVCRNILGSIKYENLGESWLNSLKNYQPGGETQIRKLLKQFNDFAETYDDMNFTNPYLSKIKSSTLIIHGDRDQLFPIDIPVDLYKSIPDSYLWIIPDFMHDSMQNDIWLDYYIKMVNHFFTGQFINNPKF